MTQSPPTVSDESVAELAKDWLDGKVSTEWALRHGETLAREVLRLTALAADRLERLAVYSKQLNIVRSGAARAGIDEDLNATEYFEAYVAAAGSALSDLKAERGKVELTFTEFRQANKARCIKWHPAGIASWSPSDWLTAVTGELGELASLLKMRNRERDGLPGNKFSPTNKQVADELADVLTYLDLLAEVLGIDLGRAAVEKFNEVSERVGFPDRIRALAQSGSGAGEGEKR